MWCIFSLSNGRLNNCSVIWLTTDFLWSDSISTAQPYTKEVIPCVPTHPIYNEVLSTNLHAKYLKWLICETVFVKKCEQGFAFQTLKCQNHDQTDVSEIPMDTNNGCILEFDIKLKTKDSSDMLFFFSGWKKNVKHSLNFNYLWWGLTLRDQGVEHNKGISFSTRLT